jgi:putative transposase
MSRKKGVSYTSEQKTRIVLEMLKEEETVAQIASRHN